MTSRRDYPYDVRILLDPARSEHRVIARASSEEAVYESAADDACEAIHGLLLALIKAEEGDR